MEGLWVSAAGPASGIAFIDFEGNYLGFLPTSLFDGSITLAGTSWDFTAASRWANTTSGVPIVGGLYGSGTVSPRVRFEGSYTAITPGGNGTSFAYEYSPANALVVSAADVSGSWSTDGLTISVDAAGALTGSMNGASFGMCALTGNVTLMETGKNLFAVNVTPSQGTSGSCGLDPAQRFQGFGAVTFSDNGSAGTSLYVRSLTFIVRAANHSWFAAGLIKQ